MKIIPFLVLVGFLPLLPIDYANAGSITLSPGETLALSGIATQILPSPSTSAFTGFITVGSMLGPNDWSATAFVLTGLGLGSVGFHLDPSNSTAFGTSTVAFTGGGGDSRLLTLNFVDGNNSTDIYTDADLTDPSNSRSGTFSYTIAQATPEPSSGLLLLSGLGLAALAAAWRKVLI
jgi:PEP-CTERM motif